VPSCLTFGTGEERLWGANGVARVAGAKMCCAGKEVAEGFGFSLRELVRHQQNFQPGALPRPPAAGAEGEPGESRVRAAGPGQEKKQHGQQNGPRPGPLPSPNEREGDNGWGASAAGRDRSGPAAQEILPEAPLDGRNQKIPDEYSESLLELADPVGLVNVDLGHETRRSRRGRRTDALCANAGPISSPASSGRARSAAGRPAGTRGRFAAMILRNGEWRKREGTGRPRSGSTRE